MNEPFDHGSCYLPDGRHLCAEEETRKHMARNGKVTVEVDVRVRESNAERRLEEAHKTISYWRDAATNAQNQRDTAGRMVAHWKMKESEAEARARDAEAESASFQEECQRLRERLSYVQTLLDDGRLEQLTYDRDFWQRRYWEKVKVNDALEQKIVAISGGEEPTLGWGCRISHHPQCTGVGCR